MKRLRVPDLRRVPDPTPPGPILTSVLGAPTQLSDLHLGWSFGRRFPRLTHTGRTTVRQYQTMLEVVGEKPARHDVIVLAGLGRSAQRNRNLVADNAAEIAIRGDRFPPLYRELDPDSGSSRTGPIRAAPPLHRNWHQTSSQLACRLALRRDRCQAPTARERTAHDRATTDTDPAGPAAIWRATDRR